MFFIDFKNIFILHKRNAFLFFLFGFLFGIFLSFNVKGLNTVHGTISIPVYETSSINNVFFNMSDLVVSDSDFENIFDVSVLFYRSLFNFHNRDFFTNLTYDVNYSLTEGDGKFLINYNFSTNDYSNALSFDESLISHFNDSFFQLAHEKISRVNSNLDKSYNSYSALPSYIEINEMLFDLKEAHDFAFAVGHESPSSVIFQTDCGSLCDFRSNYLLGYKLLSNEILHYEGKLDELVSQQKKHLSNANIYVDDYMFWLNNIEITNTSDIYDSSSSFIVYSLFFAFSFLFAYILFINVRED